MSDIRKYAIKGKGGSIKIGKYNYSILEGDGLIYVNNEGKIVIECKTGVFKINGYMLQVEDGCVKIRGITIFRNDNTNIIDGIYLDDLEVLIYN